MGHEFGEEVNQTAGSQLRLASNMKMLVVELSVLQPSLVVLGLLPDKVKVPTIVKGILIQLKLSVHVACTKPETPAVTPKHSIEDSVCCIPPCSHHTFHTLTQQVVVFCIFSRMC